jgi:hypothetical protein
MGWAEVTEELTTNDLEPSLLRVEGGYQIHAFADWQMTTESQQKKVDAGRAGGIAKARNRQDTSGVLAGARKVLEQTASKTLLDKEEDKDKDKTLSADGRRKRLVADWKPSEEILATVDAKYPLVDIAYESERFMNYWLSTGTPMINWGLTWQNWMLRAQKELADAAKAQQPLTDREINAWMYHS